MCGICGIIKRKKITEDDKKLIKEMNDAQIHRGPDDEGIFVEEGFALGHRRLSVFDLSQAGHQPMVYKDRYVISYNGEIYNYPELKKELQRAGHCFISHTDTEVILAAFEQWGMECLKKFHGFWAFALFDRDRKELVLSRDRFGVKPLYYCINEERILFSSEIKALLKDTSIERKANENVIQDFLINGLADFSDETFFKGIFKVPAGSNLIIQKDLTYQVQRFYTVSFSESVDGKLRNQDIRQFRKLFAHAVKWRLRSDVPIGSCLSGGLDSSSIVCQAGRILEKKGKKDKVHTFSACYKNFVLDEKKYMDETVKEAGAKAEFVYPDSKKLIEDLEDVIYHQDEPFGSLSIYASYCVMRKAKEQGIVVLLDGQGADEILCGYRKSRIYYIKKLVTSKKYAAAFKELFCSLLQFQVTELRADDISKIRQVLGRKKDMKKEKRFLNREFAKKNLAFRYDSAQDFMSDDFYKISLPALLRFADRNSMAFSIEDRLPFLDASLVEFAAGLPLAAKIKNGYSKYIMRKALPMPDIIRKRKDKIGFSTPDLLWIKENQAYFLGIFQKDSFRAERFIDYKKIVREWEQIMSGQMKLDIFRYICLELWMEKFDVC